MIYTTHPTLLPQYLAAGPEVDDAVFSNLYPKFDCLVFLYSKLFYFLLTQQFMWGGLNFLLLLAVWCHHFLLHTRLFSHQNLFSPREHRLSLTSMPLVTFMSILYLLSDSRVRRIIVPTTCCTRLALRAGDLLLHRSFSSIYLRRQREREGYELQT